MEYKSNEVFPHTAQISVCSPQIAGTGCLNHRPPGNQEIRAWKLEKQIITQFAWKYSCQDGAGKVILNEKGEEGTGRAMKHDILID